MIHTMQSIHKNIAKEYAQVVMLVVVITFFAWLPFLLKSNSFAGIPISNKCIGMQCIHQNFDGPYYIIPAKTWYDRHSFEKLQTELPLPYEYFAAHLPGYPLLISLIAPFIGYVQAALFVSVMATVLFASLFYYIVKHLGITKNPLLLTAAMLLLPRFLVIHSVSSPESLFMLCIIASLYFFEKQNILLAGIFGALACTVKVPGILLLVAYLCVFAERYGVTKKIPLHTLYIGIIPFGLLAVFTLYAAQMGNFWAYFNTGGVVAMPHLFSAFNFDAKWVGTAWLEEIVLYAAIYIGAIIILKDSKYRSFFYFTLVFFVATMFVQHKDIPRYLLPIWPLAVIAYEKTITSKNFIWLILFLLPIIYMYAWNFMSFNIAPISDWSALL
jgi:hypothetical protein